MLIVHITTPAEWERAQRDGAYTADSLVTQGFIHCSEPRQVEWVLGRHFQGRTGLILLHIDPSRLDADVRYENLEGGEEMFPHVYGAIPVLAVVRVTKL
jgi:uncharacterized protein (DUF952 family)